MAKALYVGSFDPPTNGHMHVIETASRIFEKLFVGVAVNEAKKSTFDVVNRLSMLVKAIGSSKLANVEVVQIRDGEFAASVAADLGCQFLVRGVRGTLDLEAEAAISGINTLAAPGIETIVLMSPRRLADVSSSTVRGLTKLRGWRGVVRQMVPASTMAALEITRAYEYHEDKRLGLETTLLGLKELIHRYISVDRMYHGIGHIVECLDWLKMVIETNAVPMDYLYYHRVATAIWFHDAVYDPQRSDNEAQSAALTENYGANALREMILATARHFDPTFEPDDLPTKLLLDIDLASFASSKKEQEWISKAIRREYKHVPHDAYREGRVRLLRQLLAKPNIYRTKAFREMCEERARENIAWEISELEAGRV